MKLFNKTSILAIGAAAVLAFGATTAQAQVTFNASATVDQAAALVIAETVPMDLGTILASRRGGGGGAVATYAIGADGANATTVTNGAGADGDSIVESAAGDRATFDITGGINNATVQIELPAAPVTLTCSGCAPTNPTFTLGSFVDDGGDGVATLDGSGEITFYVGATLSTVAGTDPYEAGTYSGNYDVTVTY